MNRPLSASRVAAPIDVAIWLHDPDVACWRLSPLQQRRLAAALPRARIVRCRDAGSFKSALATAQVAVSWVFRQEWLERAPRLTWLAAPAAGREAIHAVRPGLTVTHGSFHGQIIAETVAAMLLAENRGLLAACRAQQAGEPWPRAALAPRQRCVRGTHAVIVGFGAIGQRIGAILKPLGIRLTGVRRRARAPRPAYFDTRDRVVSAARLDALLPQADHLILALPGDSSTEGLIDARRLARLKRGAAVYNIGRGNVLDETALRRALVAGRLRAACLDVFRQEPLPAEAPLRDAPNLLVMPHASAIAPEYLDLFCDEFVARFRQRYGGRAAKSSTSRRFRR